MIEYKSKIEIVRAVGFDFEICKFSKSGTRKLSSIGGTLRSGAIFRVGAKEGDPKWVKHKPLPFKKTLTK